ILITGLVLDGEGRPVPDALVEIWQADARGHFNHPSDPDQALADQEFRGFGRADTRDGGRFWFKSVKPGRVPGADGRLQAPHIGDPELAALFSDESYVRALLTVESALARVQAALALIPADAAVCIAGACESLPVDWERLRAGTANDGFPMVELVRQLQSHAGSASAPFVHWGATTYD